MSSTKKNPSCLLRSAVSSIKMGYLAMDEKQVPSCLSSSAELAHTSLWVTRKFAMIKKGASYIFHR
jgi:hypothetical protein